MKKIIAALLPALLFTSAFAYTQSSDSTPSKPPKELAIDFNVVQQPIASFHFIGINNNIKAYVTRRWVTGSYLTISEKKINNSFNYTVGKPVVEYGEAGWLNGFDVLQTPHWRINANLVNGIAYARLGDDDIKIEHTGTHGRYYRSKHIATNLYYLLEPGIDVSYRVAFFHHSPDVYLTARSSYRALAGGSRFGERTDFTGSLFGIGVSLIGYDRDDNKTAKKQHGNQ